MREGLRRRADPAKAPEMQAYMKSEMPYLGVQAPALRAVCREVFGAHPLETYRRWRRDAVMAIWRRADYREECYAAIRPVWLPPVSRIPDLGKLPMLRGDGDRRCVVGLCRRCAVNARSADIIRGQRIEVLVKPVAAAMLYDVVQYPHRVWPSFSQAEAPE